MWYFDKLAGEHKNKKALLKLLNISLSSDGNIYIVIL